MILRRCAAQCVKELPKTISGNIRRVDPIKYSVIILFAIRVSSVFRVFNFAFKLNLGELRNTVCM